MQYLRCFLFGQRYTYGIIKCQIVGLVYFSHSLSMARIVASNSKQLSNNRFSLQFRRTRETCMNLQICTVILYKFLCLFNSFVRWGLVLIHCASRKELLCKVVRRQKAPGEAIADKKMYEKDVCYFNREGKFSTYVSALVSTSNSWSSINSWRSFFLLTDGDIDVDPALSIVRLSSDITVFAPP